MANYAVTAVDDTGSKKITAPQLEKFLNARRPADAENRPGARKFEANATEKGGLNLSEAAVGPVMTIGQFFEILILLLLPLALAKLGFTLTIAIGIAAWALRYALFALGTPVWLVLASQGLHGFGFGFFFVGCMIYSDRIAPKDIRAAPGAYHLRELRPRNARQFAGGRPHRRLLRERLAPHLPCAGRHSGPLHDCLSDRLPADARRGGRRHWQNACAAGGPGFDRGYGGAEIYLIVKPLLKQRSLPMLIHRRTEPCAVIRRQSAVQPMLLGEEAK